MKNLIKTTVLALLIAAIPLKVSFATTPCTFFSCGGPYGGMAPPTPLAGISMGVFPYGYASDIGTLAMVANTVYYVPYPIFQTETIAGSQIHDSGAGNNGMHVRTALYAQSASGGPGALLKDFGAVSLTGTAALHQAANSVTVSGPQMAYLAIVSDSTPTLYTMGFLTTVSSVGDISTYPLATLLGDIGGGSISSALGARFPIVGWNASLTYGAFPSTATAPSANTVSTNSSGSTVGTFAVQLYY